MKTGTKAENPTRWKRFLFTAFTCFIPLLAVLSLETMLSIFDYGGDWSLFVQSDTPYEDYLKVNPNICRRYFGRQFTLPKPANDVFLKKKPENGYRIMVMGSSTALGFPYGNLLMFSRILHRRLQDTFPRKRIEVVNTALTAINSWTLLDIIDEILEVKPDVILIYTGHNEYYGALGVASLESIGRSRFIIRLNLFLNRYRIIRFFRDVWRSISVKKPVEGTLMRRIVKKRLIPYDSPLYHAGLEQFEHNMRHFLGKTRKASVPVLIGDLVSNHQDQLPLDGVDSVDSTAAEIVFQAAKTAEDQKQYVSAGNNYVRAKDLDGIRFRAPAKINEIIHRLANEHEAIVVAIEEAFETHSTNGLIGSNLMVDHLHPNIDGCFLMADLFYEAMKARDLIASDWDSTAPSSGWYRSNWPITTLDTTLAVLIMKNLKSDWPFQAFEKNKPFLKRFKPSSMVEDLALRILKEKITVGDAHLILAGRYEAIGDTYSANREYDVLTHLVLIEAYHYLWRAEAFLRRGQKWEALAMLEFSLSLENIPQAQRLYRQLIHETGNKKLDIESQK